MPTAKQIAANRRNAQKSCGPKTEAGKKIASQNAFRHGLCAPFLVLPHVENQGDFDYLVESFIEAEKPTDAVERELVITMAEQLWLANRATRMQNTQFVAQEPTPDQKKESQFPIKLDHDSIQLFMRYHTAHYRAYRQAMQDLQTRRKQKQLQEIGSVRKEQAEAEEVRREKRQIQRDEVHAARMATRKKQDELLTYRVWKAGHAAAQLFEGIIPPDFTAMAA
jgi:hypothetical protein